MFGFKKWTRKGKEFSFAEFLIRHSTGDKYLHIYHYLKFSEELNEVSKSPFRRWELRLGDEADQEDSVS